MKKSIIVILIIVLLVVLGVGVYLYRVDKSQNQVDETLKTAEEIWNLKNENSELKEKIENGNTENFTADVNFDPNKMKSDSNNVRYEEANGIELDNSGLKIEIQEGKPYLSTDVTNPQYQFHFSNVTEIIENKELTGFNGSVTNVYFAYMGNGDMAPYILFIMEDGSVEYINSVKMLNEKRYESFGKIEEISNIVKFTHLNAQEVGENGEGLSGWITVVAIDGDGYSYDLSSSETLQNDMLLSY